MRRSLRLSLIAAPILLILVAVGAYIFSKLERYEEQVALGPSPEARADNYLAAEHFLRNQGRKVQRATSIEELDSLESRGQTLLLLGNRRKLSPQQSEHLLAWAEEGGHLVIVARNNWDPEQESSGDPLLDNLGIRRYSIADLDSLEREQKAQNLQPQKLKKNRAPTDKHENPQPYPQLTKLYLENDTAPAYFNFCTCSHLYDAHNLAHAWANSDDATHLLQLYQGDGIITVINDADIWNNLEIGQYDHAWLLWYLTQDTDVTLLSQIDSDNLAQLLLRHYPEALAAAALLILLLLWQQAARVGPIAPAPALERRSLTEHLRASAEFLLRQHNQAYLIKHLQQDILQRARRLHPGFERVTPLEQRRLLSLLCGQPQTLVNQAMSAPSSEPLRPAQFTEKVRHLQILRNAL